MSADPKRPKRYRATSQEWAELHLSFTAELCWCCGQAWDSLHHIYPRGQGGDDVRENLAPVCGNGTMGCHGLLEDRDPWARGALYEALTYENFRYLVDRLGPTWQGWLERNYPSTGDRVTRVAA